MAVRKDDLPLRLPTLLTFNPQRPQKAEDLVAATLLSGASRKTFTGYDRVQSRLERNVETDYAAVLRENFSTAAIVSREQAETVRKTTFGINDLTEVQRAVFRLTSTDEGKAAAHSTIEREVAQTSNLGGALLLGSCIAACGRAETLRLMDLPKETKPYAQEYATYLEHAVGYSAQLGVEGTSIYQVYTETRQAMREGKPLPYDPKVFNLMAEFVKMFRSDDAGYLLNKSADAYHRKYPHLAWSRAIITGGTLIDVMELNAQQLAGFAKRANGGWKEAAEAVVVMKTALQNAAAQTFVGFANHDPEVMPHVEKLFARYTSDDDLDRTLRVMGCATLINLRMLYRKISLNMEEGKSPELYSRAKKSIERFARKLPKDSGVLTTDDLPVVYNPEGETYEEDEKYEGIHTAAKALTELTVNDKFETPTPYWYTINPPDRHNLKLTGADRSGVQLTLYWDNNGQTTALQFHFLPGDVNSDWSFINLPKESDELTAVFSSGYCIAKDMIAAEIERIQEARQKNGTRVYTAPAAAEKTHSLRPSRVRNEASPEAAISENSAESEQRRFTLPYEVIKKLPPEMAERARAAVRDANNGLPRGFKLMPTRHGITIAELRDRDIRILFTPDGATYVGQFVVSREDMDNNRFKDNMWKQLARMQTARAQEAAKQRKSKKYGA